ncbi:hypothetical protein D3C73_942740 [compost metagenome]
MPGIFFHIICFGGKPNDKRTISIECGNPGDNIRVFDHFYCEFITLRRLLFDFFMGYGFCAIISDGGTANKNMLLLYD